MKRRIALCVLTLTAAFLMSSTNVIGQIASPNPGDPATLARTFIDLLAKSDYTAAAVSFDSTMKAALPPAKLEQTWKSMQAQVGPFKNQGSIRTSSAGAYTLVLVTCDFEKMTLDAKVVYNSARQIAGLFFVPTQPAAQKPAEPADSTVDAREVMIGKGHWALHGTLTYPKGAGPFPALVLVHGSGPNDRDETVGPNKPFRDLAEGLAKKGIAVLRYEKRTKEHAMQMAPLRDSLTVREETIEDALLAVQCLRTMDRIDPRRIFVLGHSLGGMLIPRIGALDSAIAGLIVMAGSTRPMEDLILDQVTYIVSIDGTVSEQEKSQLEMIKRQVAKVKDPGLSSATPREDLPLSIPARYWLDLRGYDPPAIARTLRQRMLILQGERDYQVTMKDFDGWKSALSSRSDVTLKTYPALNHLFIEGKEKSTPAEYSTAGRMSSQVIDDIAVWVGK